MYFATIKKKVPKGRKEEREGGRKEGKNRMMSKVLQRDPFSNIQGKLVTS